MSGKREKIIIASWVSILGNALLAIAKLILGFISGSFAVIADGIDSTVDIISSIVSLIAARVVLRPPNVRFPYGYIKADTIATKVLSMLIVVAGVQLLIATIRNFFNPANEGLPEMLAVYVTVFSICGKLALGLYLRSTGKKLNSNMLITMGFHMRSDMMISLTVLVSLVLTLTTKTPVVDSVFALLISLYIIFEAFRIFLRSNTELMDGIQDSELYPKLFEAVNSVDGASNPHRARARKIGNYFMINLDIEVDPEMSVKEAHDIAKHVENHIKRSIERVYDVMVHVEPRGNVEKDEKFGVSEHDVS